MAVKWRTSLETGIAEIDDQHKQLFERINKLFESCNQCKGKEEVANVIKFLEDYVVTHFSAEERLQKKYGYPDFEAHKKMHEGFIESFLKLKEQIKTEGATTHSVILVNRIVVDWLINHIGNTDKALGVFLKPKL
jgi:hemerythrin